MSTQSEYEKNKAAAEKAYSANKAAAANARAKKKEQDDAKKNISSLRTQISILQSSKVAPAKTAIKELEAQIALRQTEYNTQYKARLPHDTNDLIALSTNPTYGSTVTNGLLATKALRQKDLAAAEAEIKKAEAKITELTPISQGKKASTKKQQYGGIYADQYKGLKGPGDSSTGGLIDTTFSVGYKYNAPMVSSAYFGKGIAADSVANSPFTTIKPDQFAYYNAYAQQAFQDSLLTNDRYDPDPNIGSINVPMFEDARDTWMNTRGGRGVLQMDQIFTQSLDQSGFVEYSNTGNAGLDRQLYGFKFLYNPTTVSMAWDINDTMDPPYLASGKDKFSVVSTGLMSSTVGFELMLNRIDDLNHLNEFGEMRNDTNPYPINVPIEDRKDLWKKGTMYDLEYLFRAINGPNANFTSLLNGDTADKGWLRPTILELHLGKSLRYRVRVADLAVNHIIFSKEMVPILSTVRLTVKRMVDGPMVVTKTKD